MSLAGISVLEPRNQLSGRFGARALWKAGQKFVRNCQRLLVIMQHLGKQTGLIKKHTEWITAISYSPDGKYLASADRNGGVEIWESGADPKP